MPVVAHSEILQALNSRAEASGWTFACSPAQDFEHAGLADALVLWRQKANGRPMPLRADMTARAMKPYLTNMSLLERVTIDGQMRYRVRLHGSALARYAGDNTGKFLEEVVGLDRLGAYRNIYDTVIALRTPLRVVSHYQAPEIDYHIGESLVAPLAVPGSDTPIILSVTYARPRAELARLTGRFAAGEA
jgi:hypothetical protein